MLKTSFTNKQIQALRVLLSLPWEQQQAALQGCLETPRTPSLRRRSSCGMSTASSSSSLSPGSATSVLGLDDQKLGNDDKKRIHHNKTSPKKLSKFLAQKYFGAKNIWQHLYNHRNRVDNDRLDAILDQIKDKLTERQIKCLEQNRIAITKDLKKKSQHLRVQIQRPVRGLQPIPTPT